MDQLNQQPAQSVPPQPTPPAAAQPPTQPEAKSSPKKLIIIFILVVLLVVGGVMAWQATTQKSTSLYQDASKTPSVSPTVTAPTPSTGAVNSGDPQLDEQSSAIDKSMSQLEEDAKGVDQGLQDQPVDLN